MGDVRYANGRGGGRSCELGGVHEDGRAPCSGQREEIREHRRCTDRTEHLGEHVVG